MPIISTLRHQHPFIPFADENERLNDVEALLETLCAVQINPRVKKMMLDRVVWLVAQLTGDFYSRYRSHGTLRADGARIQRDHVHTRKFLVSELQIPGTNLRSIIERAHCCIVTREEHARLNRVPNNFQGWARYHHAGVRVRNMQTNEDVVYSVIEAPI